MVKGGAAFPVHQDLAFGKHVLDTGLGLSRENLEQVLKKEAFVGYLELLSGHNSSSNL